MINFLTHYGLYKDLVQALVWLLVIAILGFVIQALITRLFNRHQQGQEKIADLLDPNTKGGNQEIKKLLEDILKALQK